jgi:hypothetical protein
LVARLHPSNVDLLLGTPRVVRELPLASACIDGKELVDALDDVNSGSVFGVKFNRVDKEPARVRPAAGVNYLRPAYSFVRGIAIGL